MQREQIRSILVGGFIVAAIFGGLIALLTLVTGRSPGGDGSERMIYRKVGGIELGLHIYKPENWKPEDRRPCVAWFFGGGWETGDVRQFAKQAAHLADRGLVSFTVEYRIRSRHQTTPFDAVDDAIAAMYWLRDHAGEMGIDQDRIAAGGGSAGGHLAAACAMFPDDPVPAALVLFNPILDIDIPAVRERVGGEKFESLLEISPTHRLGKPLPPTLIIHGSADQTVPFHTSEAFVEKAREFGTETITLKSYRGKSHEFYHYGLNANRDFKETMETIENFLAGIGWLADR